MNARKLSALRHKQNGMALMMLVFIVALAGVAGFLIYLDGSNVKIERDKKTVAALAEAKAALIGYAASYDKYPGGLPCPDVDNDGKGDRYETSGKPSISGPECSSQTIGRLPWKDLNIAPVRDGSGECLWYVMTPLYRSALPISQRKTQKLNANSSGALSIYNESLVLFQTDIVAIIFAPNEPLQNQSRSSSINSICGGSTDSSAYLDAKSHKESDPNSTKIFDNAHGKIMSVSSLNNFVIANRSKYSNDQMLVISRQDLWGGINKRVLKTILGNPISGLIDYSEKGRFPFADTDGDKLENLAQLRGRVPIDELTFDEVSKKWISNNEWISLIDYETDAGAQNVKMSLGQIKLKVSK